MCFHAIDGDGAPGHEGDNLLARPEIGLAHHGHGLDLGELGDGLLHLGGAR